MPQETNEIDEIDLVELFFELLAHWKMIAASTILTGTIAALVSLFLMTPLYESTSALYVLSKSTSITSLADVQLGTNLANDYVVVSTGRPVLEQVIKNLDLNLTYEQLKSMIQVNNPSNSRILEITVTDSNPKTAKLIADETAEVISAFIAEKMDQDPPTIIQRGYSDGNPVSPHKTKNTMLGALAGMIIACGIVILSFLLNDTIVTEDDITKKLGLNVLGVIPYEEEEKAHGRKVRKNVKNKMQE